MILSIRLDRIQIVIAEESVEGAHRFVRRVRNQLRRELIASAEALVIDNGWRRLRMQSVARAVGVSRQTLYTEFPNKMSLGLALLAARTDIYLREHEQIVERAEDPSSALYAILGRALELFTEDSMLNTMISPDDKGDIFLSLFTSPEGPLLVTILALARERISAVFLSRWTDLDRHRLQWVIEALTRLAVSHVMFPTHPAEQVAREAAEALGPLLLTRPS